MYLTHFSNLFMLIHTSTDNYFYSLNLTVAIFKFSAWFNPLFDPILCRLHDKIVVFTCYFIWGKKVDALLCFCRSHCLSYNSNIGTNPQPFDYHRTWKIHNYET